MANKITFIIRSVVQKLPNLEKRFPTEESRYSAYIKFLYLALVCGASSSLSSGTVARDDLLHSGSDLNLCSCSGFCFFN